MGIEKPVFTLIPMPEFEGEMETLSVKLPSELKALFKDLAKARKRNLSEVVVHALTEYGKHFENELRAKKKR